MQPALLPEFWCNQAKQVILQSPILNSGEKSWLMNALAVKCKIHATLRYPDTTLIRPIPGWPL